MWHGYGWDMPWMRQERRILHKNEVLDGHIAYFDVSGYHVMHIYVNASVCQFCSHVTTIWACCII